MNCPKCGGFIVKERAVDLNLVFYILRCLNCGKIMDPPAGEGGSPRPTNQLGRRNLTDDQRAIIVDELIEKQGRVNRQEQTRDDDGKFTVVDAVSTTVSDNKPRVRTTLSHKAKVS